MTHAEYLQATDAAYDRLQRRKGRAAALIVDTLPCGSTITVHHVDERRAAYEREIAAAHEAHAAEVEAAWVAYVAAQAAA